MGHGSGSPCLWPPSWRALVLSHLGRRHVRPPTCRASETTHRLSAKPECLRGRGEGLPGYEAILCVRAMVEHPAGYGPLLAQITQRSLWPSSHPARSASGKARGFGAAFPWPARSHASASPRPFLKPSQGLLPARVGSPLTGRVSHSLDDKQSFMKTLQPPIPFDPQGLVALDITTPWLTQSTSPTVAMGGTRARRCRKSRCVFPCMQHAEKIS